MRKSYTALGKRCPSCKLLKRLDAFHVREDGRPASYCKECLKVRRKTRPRIRKPILKTERYYERRLLRKLKRVGLALEEYEKLEQHCIICGSTKKLRLDHNHKTSLFRGILCDACNTSIGLLNEDPERIRRAALYVVGELTEAAFSKLPEQPPK